MEEGTVKFFNEQKGFGFIRSNDSGKDVFVHESGLLERISDNDNVTFEVQEGDKGLKAVNVRRAQ